METQHFPLRRLLRSFGFVEIPFSINKPEMWRRVEASVPGSFATAAATEDTGCSGDTPVELGVRCDQPGGAVHCYHVILLRFRLGEHK